RVECILDGVLGLGLDVDLVVSEGVAILVDDGLHAGSVSHARASVVVEGELVDGAQVSAGNQVSGHPLAHEHADRVGIDEMLNEDAISTPGAHATTIGRTSLSLRSRSMRSTAVR